MAGSIDLDMLQVAAEMACCDTRGREEPGWFTWASLGDSSKEKKISLFKMIQMKLFTNQEETHRFRK